MKQTAPTWLVLAWRLPTGGSTDRVWVWRSLRRLGAAGLTPGAAALPYTEELQEQLDWLAQEVDQHGGDAWVLPVTQLSGDEERRIRDRVNADRQAEYAALHDDAMSFLRRSDEHPAPGSGAGMHLRLRTEKELVTLQRRFQRIRTRDHFGAPGRQEAAATIDRCLAFRQGISRKLTAMTDSRPDG